MFSPPLRKWLRDLRPSPPLLTPPDRVYYDPQADTPLPLNTAPNNMLQVMKFDSGGYYQWAKILTGNFAASGSIAVDPSGKIYLSGMTGTKQMTISDPPLDSD